MQVCLHLKFKKQNQFKIEIFLQRKCKLVPLCWNCSECHDIIECQTLQKLELPENFLIENFDVVTPLRFLFRLYRCAEQMKSNFGDDSTKTDIDDILSLESHCVERKGTWIWNEHAKCVIDPLHKISIDKIFESVNSPWPITDDFFQKICGILDVNTFEVRTEHFEVGSGNDNCLLKFSPFFSISGISHSRIIRSGIVVSP